MGLMISIPSARVDRHRVNARYTSLKASSEGGLMMSRIEMICTMSGRRQLHTPQRRDER